MHLHRRAGAAAEARPVMPYSFGKDSSVLLHDARKAFWPAPSPMPLLHVDTTWKFRDMIAFATGSRREGGEVSGDRAAEARVPP